MVRYIDLQFDTLLSTTYQVTHNKVSNSSQHDVVSVMTPAAPSKVSNLEPLVWLAAAAPEGQSVEHGSLIETLPAAKLQCLAGGYGRSLLLGECRPLPEPPMSRIPAMNNLLELNS